MADILNDLTNLNLGVKPVLGNRLNVEEAVRKAKEDAKLNSTQEMTRTDENRDTIVISSGSEGAGPLPQRFQRSKAFLLNQLSERASTAGDNATLAKMVQEFAAVLQVNSSRTLTREAFYFLDVLFKQLDDPSVFVKPSRCVSPFSE